jgi:hypothetical protein
VLREGMAVDMLELARIYFGTTGGTLYASSDSGAHWRPIAEGLSRIQSVEVSIVSENDFRLCQGFPCWGSRAGARNREKRPPRCLRGDHCH